MLSKKCCDPSFITFDLFPFSPYTFLFNSYKYIRIAYGLKSPKIPSIHAHIYYTSIYTNLYTSVYINVNTIPLYTLAYENLYCYNFH